MMVYEGFRRIHGGFATVEAVPGVHDTTYPSSAVVYVVFQV